jgi:hypothetical protein
MITFTQAGQTQIYSPNSTSADGGHLLYLLVAPSSGGGSIQVDQTWGASATDRGFFLFLDTTPSSIPTFANLIPPALVQALGHPLDAIANSSFAWVTGTNSLPSVIALIEAGLDGSQPVVQTSTTIKMPLPFYSLPLMACTPIITTAEQGGGIAGFVFTYPAIPPVRGQPASQPPDGNGLALPLLGSGRGAFQFFGLFNREAVSGSASDSADKDLYQVSADPVAPFDSDRTYMALTNQSYRITEVNNQFTITPI